MAVLATFFKLEKFENQDLLFSVDCGEAFRSFWVGAPTHSMDPSSVSGWHCPNCKICEISGDVLKDELQMRFCDMCD